jgi:hypothetical protein
MRKRVRFYIQLSFHVAFAVLALTKITSYYFDLSLTRGFWIGLFCLVVFGYNLIKNSALWVAQPLTSNLLIKGITTVAFFGAVYLIFPKTIPQCVVLFGVVLLSGFYIFPLNASKKNFRDRHGLKIYVVASVWALVSVGMPLVYGGFFFEMDVILLFISRWFFVITATVPFEIRDVEKDALHLATWPQSFGIKGAKIRGTLAWLVFVIIESSLVFDTNYVAAFGFVGVALLVFLWMSSERQSEFYSSFWVEALPIFWWLIMEYCVI